MNTGKTIGRILAASAILGVGLAAGTRPGATFTTTPAHAAPALSSPVWPFTAIQHVVIHNLYMDNNWDADNPPALSRATLDDFTNKLVLSGYFSKAFQYGVADAAFTGSDQGTAACPAPGAGFGYTALSSWVLCQKHSLPNYQAYGNGVNIWQVYTPVQASMHMSITWPWGNTTQVVQNCQTLGGAPWDGFHLQTLPSIFPPDVPQTFGAVFPGCNGGALAATTIAASHELIEAATDPSGFAWGTGALGGQEAGDLCENGMPSTGSFDSGRYQFAAYWSNADSACVVPGNGAFPPPPPSPLAKVPGVIGDWASDAAMTVRAAGFTVAFNYFPDRSCNYLGRVTAERPGPGSFAPMGSTVTLTVGTKPSTPCP